MNRPCEALRGRERCRLAVAVALLAAACAAPPASAQGLLRDVNVTGLGDADVFFPHDGTRCRTSFDFTLNPSPLDATAGPKRTVVAQFQFLDSDCPHSINPGGWILLAMQGDWDAGWSHAWTFNPGQNFRLDVGPYGTGRAIPFVYSTTEQFNDVPVSVTGAFDDALAPAAAPPLPALDADGDGIPDAAEGQVCGRASVAQAVNGLGGAAGTCRAANDYSAPAPNVADADGDGVADVAEGQVCGRALVADNVNRFAPLAGRCHSPTDYEPPVAVRPDADGDLVPDAAEPAVCRVENVNSPSDGSCDGDDYRPPMVPLV